MPYTHLHCLCIVFSHRSELLHGGFFMMRLNYRQVLTEVCIFATVLTVILHVSVPYYNTSLLFNSLIFVLCPIYFEFKLLLWIRSLINTYCSCFAYSCFYSCICPSFATHYATTRGKGLDIFYRFTVYSDVNLISAKSRSSNYQDSLDSRLCLVCGYYHYPINSKYARR